MRFLWFWWNLTLTGKVLSLLVLLGLAAGGWVLLAQNVEVSENGSDGLIAITTPTPAPTQQPSITPSPPPTATATPLPTRSPTPATSPTPTARPAVTPSPTPIPTPRLTATAIPPGAATPTPVATATPTPAPAPTGPGQMVRNVRITYTSCDGDGACGTMASGRQVYRGAAACNPSLLPFGTRIRIVGYSQVLTCEDISPALSGWYVVVWFPTEEEGSAFLNQVGRIGTIEVLSRP